MSDTGATYILGPNGARIRYGAAYVVWTPSTAPGPSVKPLRRARRRPTKKLAIGMSTYTSAAELLRRVADFSQRQPDWAECIVYDTLPDERWDLTLVSQRVYGNRDEVLAVMASAGLDSVEQELPARRLVLPTARQLQAMKTVAGFVGSQWDRAPELAADPVNGR